MPLLGTAAMLLNFDVAPEAVAEHDDWHTHEHLPERLSIPGFVRGTRWVALRGKPRYFVIYEVEKLETLTSPPYLERLNNPTPWTRKMMPHYRGMRRGFCALAASLGVGLGHLALLLRFKPAPHREDALRQWLAGEALPPLVTRPGIGSAHLFAAALQPPMTDEQRIRGADAGFDWALVVTGYAEEALGQLLQDLPLERQATAEPGTLYRMDYALARGELGA